MSRRRERIPTPVFWTGVFHGLYSPWGLKELDTTERLSPVTIFWVVSSFIWLRIKLLGFPCDSVGKESSCNVGDLGLIPGLGRSPGEGKGYPLQYSDLENCMDCIVTPWGYRVGHN